MITLATLLMIEINRFIIVKLYTNFSFIIISKPMRGLGIRLYISGQQCQGLY